MAENKRRARLAPGPPLAETKTNETPTTLPAECSSLADTGSMTLCTTAGLNAWANYLRLSPGLPLGFTSAPVRCSESRVTKHSVPFGLIVTAFQSLSTAVFVLLQAHLLRYRGPKLEFPRSWPISFANPKTLLWIHSHKHTLPSSPTLVTSSRCGLRWLGLTCPGAPMFHFETHSSCLYDRPPIEERIGSAFGTLRGKWFTLGCKSYQNMQ